MNINEYYLDIEKIESTGSSAYNVYTLFNNMISFYYETTSSPFSSQPTVSHGKEKATIIFNTLLISGYLKNIRESKIDNIISPEVGN